MRLVDDEGIRVGRAHARQQNVIARHARTAQPHGQIVGHLSRHQHTPLARWRHQLHLGRPSAVLGDALAHQPSHQQASAMQ